MTQEREPLLQNAAAGAKGSPAVLPSLARSVLKFLMWAVFLTWAAGIFFYPTAPVQAAFRRWAAIASTEGLITGLTGSVFLFFSGPILIIAALAYVYIFAFPGDHVGKKKLRSLSFRLWTYPVLVDGPFGVVSAAEFIGIVMFIVYVVFSMTYYVVDSVSLISQAHLPPTTRSELLLALIGLRFGSVGLFCMIFLFLPVSRGSVLLRLIDIPFEHATRYHVWLGHLTMALFTLHGLCYVISYSLLGRLIEELTQWKQVGIANLPGVISLVAGLLMWVTSLHPVRKRFFELFFYTHQLYVVFVVFLVLHVGDFVFSISAGAVFLFMLDRFLRFWQSRAKVDIVSAACRPCGTVELVFSKPASLRYNALSFIFVQVRELSFLQWHPFSVSSSPMDGRYHMSILIKVLGTWTDTLKRIITDVQEQKTRSDSDSDQSQTGRITASIEGPYGHESPYHLMYENLILVAGGIGISPFVAILSDIIHRIEQGMPCAPKNVLVLWSVKKTSELSLLLAVDAQSISSSVCDKLQAFVAPSASLIGDVEVGPGSSIWYGCVLRGDANNVQVGSGTNIQDNSVVHVAKSNLSGKVFPTIIGDNVTVGHSAVLQGCTVEDEAFVGMGATLLDGVVVEKHGMVAAGALVRQNTRIPCGEVWGGNPAKFLRKLTDEEIGFIGESSANYSNLARAHAVESAKPMEKIDFEKVLRKKFAHQVLLSVTQEVPPELPPPSPTPAQ